MNLLISNCGCDICTRTRNISKILTGGKLNEEECKLIENLLNDTINAESELEIYQQQELRNKNNE